MFHLLPEKEKKVLKREYLYRLTVVFLSFCITSVVIASVFLFPSYLISERKLKDIQIENTSIQNTLKKITDPALSGFLASLNGNLKALTPPTVTASSSVLLKEIIDKQTDGVTINQFSITNQDTETILVGGTAQDRNQLTLFLQALQSLPEFSKVDLPISDFAKDKDIDFHMTITVKK